MAGSSHDEEGQLKCLLADFNSIKTEIVRRSTLQRFVLVAQLAVLALVFQQAATSALTSLWVVGLWVSSALAFQFYAREGLEIARLGAIISKKIAPIASELTGAAPQYLFPSQTDPEATDTLERRSAYNREFMWAVFFVIPMLLTVLFTAARLDRVGHLVQPSTLTPWAAVAVGGLIIRVFVLLRR